MSRTLTWLLSLALASAACGDRSRSAVADSDLARDIALANQTPAQPQFTDTALGTAPAPSPSAPPKRTPTTARSSTTRRPSPAPTSVQPSAPEPQPVGDAPAPAPSHTAPGFSTGTSFGLVTRSPVCTTNLPGDKFTATLASTVVGENGAVLPAGTIVVLEVASVTPGDTPEDARIALRVRSFVVNDEPVNVEGDVAVVSDLERRQVPRDKGSDRKKVVAGAVAGAILGQIMGKDTKSTVIGAAAGGAAGAAAAAASRKYDACLPAGGSVRVTTSQPISLRA